VYCKFLKRPELKRGKTMKIMIIRPGALGDTLVCIPLIKFLCSRHQVSFLGREPGIFFVKKLISHVYDIEVGFWHKIFEEAYHSDHAFNERYDRVVCFFRSNLEVIKKNLANLFQTPHVDLYPNFPDLEERIHILKYISNCLENSGINVEKAEVKMTIKNGVFGKRFLKSNKIVYHVGSGSKNKNFGINFWIKVKKLVSRYLEGSHHVFLFGPAEEEAFYEYSEKLQEKDLEAIFCTEAQALEQILQGCMLYLGHDSGPTHLSALMGISTIALFKTSSIKLWRPVGRRVKILRAKDEYRILNLIQGVLKRPDFLQFLVAKEG